MALKLCFAASWSKNAAVFAAAAATLILPVPQQRQGDPTALYTREEYGRYGSPYSSDSINNPYGAGSPYRSDSPNNPYGEGLKIYGE